jgi:ferredoxin-like protein FixX
MSSKGKIRAKKHLKQRLRRAGACVTCGPMLKFPEPSADSTSTATVACISCGRIIRFKYIAGDAQSEEAIGTIVQSFAVRGGLCPHACTVSINDEMWMDGPECLSCTKHRAFFQFATSANPAQAAAQE